jgi:hypothetical protein
MLTSTKMLRAAAQRLQYPFHGVVLVAARLCGNHSALAPFLHHDTTREYAFATYVLLLWHGCGSADVGVPSQWLWTSGRL